MDYFHSSTVEWLAAAYRADALSHARRDGIARRAAASPGSWREWMPPAPIARLARLLAHASARRASIWLHRWARRAGDGRRRSQPRRTPWPRPQEL
jgi:hypothetical protein